MLKRESVEGKFYLHRPRTDPKWKRSGHSRGGRPQG